MHAITCASSPAPPRSTLKHGSMGSVHVWEGSAARAARSERGRGLPNREGATSGGNTLLPPDVPVFRSERSEQLLLVHTLCLSVC